MPQKPATGKIMSDLQVIKSDGAPAALDLATVENFAAGLRGSLLRREEGGYDAARKVWNGMIDRPAGLDRPVCRCRRYRGVGAVFARARPARLDKGWRAQRHRECGLRGRVDDRSVSDEEHPCRFG